MGSTEVVANLVRCHATQEIIIVGEILQTVVLDCIAYTIQIGNTYCSSVEIPIGPQFSNIKIHTETTTLAPCLKTAEQCTRIIRTAPGARKCSGNILCNDIKT